LLPELENDPLKDTPHCQNCSASVWEGDQYCADCGQKVLKGHPSIWKLFGDFFETIFNLDNRVFRTLAALVVPGRLTNNYLSGQRQKYLNPLRIFFVSAVIMVAMGTILTGNLVQEDLNYEVRANQKRGFYALFYEDLNEAIDSIKMDYPQAQTALDTLARRLKQSDEGEMGVGYLVYQGNGTFSGEMLTFTLSESVSMSPREMLDKAGITNWFERFQITQLIRVQSLGVQGVTALMGQSVWGLLFLIPICALMLKLIYIRRSRWLVEHFVFSLHDHTFLFLGLTLATLICYLFNHTAIGFWVMLAVTPLYFISSLKAVYRQSWGKTLFKAYLLFLGYLITISICFGISLVISIVLF
jgi:hypothetical protein